MLIKSIVYVALAVLSGFAAGREVPENLRALYSHVKVWLYYRVSTFENPVLMLSAGS